MLIQQNPSGTCTSDSRRLGERILEMITGTSGVAATNPKSRTMAWKGMVPGSQKSRNQVPDPSWSWDIWVWKFWFIWNKIWRNSLCMYIYIYGSVGSRPCDVYDRMISTIKSGVDIVVVCVIWSARIAATDGLGGPWFESQFEQTNCALGALFVRWLCDIDLWNG